MPGQRSKNDAVSTRALTGTGTTAARHRHDHPLALDPRVTLLDALREHLGLTGTKVG